MQPTAAPRTADIQRDIDHAHRHGPLQCIVVPPCPALLVELREAMAQEPVDLNGVARIAASDVAMSATLIRQANGPLYAAGQPSRTVGQAMSRLGLDMTAAVMTAFLARNAIHADNRRLAGFWEQSSQRATAMAALARLLPGLSEDLAYTCGLFLHVGLPVMLQGVPGYAGTMVEGPARKDRSYVQTENANHRTDHAVVGALVARLWQLDPEVMAAIRLHHDLDALGAGHIDPEVHTMVALALVTECLLRRREGLPPDGDWQRHGPAALDWLQVDEADLEIWRDCVAAALEEA